MKVIIIPDMHGSHNWSKALDLLADNPDAYVVGLGDWVDSWNNYWPDQGENLEMALDWFREDKEHRFFCIGNHDWSYISSSSDGFAVSGHQRQHAQEIAHILRLNKDIIYIAKQLDGWVFSHAGFTKTWYDDVNRLVAMDHKLTQEDLAQAFISDEDIQEVSLDDLNAYFQGKKVFEDPISKQRFDELLDWHGLYSSSGDDLCQGPLWVRPHSLLLDSKFDKQVVGHTEIVENSPLLIKRNNNYIALIDSPDRKNVLLFDTQNLNDFYPLNHYKPIKQYR